MKGGMHICLKPGEKIYVNGAVLRVDRKVSIEFLNDVTFLLQNHVILAEEAVTPLRQLYFIVQTMLIDPANAGTAREMFGSSMSLLCASFENKEVLKGLSNVADLVEKNRVFDALKTIRALFPIEERILQNADATAHDARIESREVA
jgi:flagellar protein FlbT